MAGTRGERVTPPAQGSDPARVARAVRACFPAAPRVLRVQALLADRSLDCVVAVGASYANWLTGYHRYVAGLSAVILTADGEVTLVTSPEEVPLAAASSSAGAVLGYGAGGFGLDLDPMSTLLGTLRGLEVLRETRHIGVAGLSSVAAAQFAWPSATDVEADLQRLSMRKDRDEAEKVAVAYNLSWEAQRAVKTAVDAGDSELEIFTRAQSVAQLAFGQPIEFIADVLAGSNSAQVSGPIGVAGSRRVEMGEPLFADIAVRAGGYWGDTCRTYVRGENREVKDGVGKLASLLDDTSRLLRPGARGRDVHAAMAASLQDLFPGAGFPHHGGHGIGVDCWENPHLIPSDGTVFEPGMIVAVEPGAYYEGRWGIRHENEYLVTEVGGVELNAALASIAGDA